MTVPPVPGIVLYHKGCMDGLAAAWAVWKKFGALQTKYIQVAYGEPPPDVTNQHVVIVDFSYDHDTLVAMSFKAHSILVLDHHKTAYEALKNLPEAAPRHGSFGKGWDEFHTDHFAYCQSNNMPLIGAMFDLNRSGAMLAWNFFHDGPPPRLLRHIEDRDLWRFHMDGSRNMHAAITAYPYTLETFDTLVRRCGADSGLLLAEGAAILRSWDKSILDALAVARREMVIGGVTVPVANLPYAMASDAGHILAKDALFSATYYDAPDARVFSLRSRADGVDVSLVAKEYGGGGHKNAAGFRAKLGWEGDEHTFAQALSTLVCGGTTPEVAPCCVPKETS